MHWPEAVNLKTTFATILYIFRNFCRTSSSFKEHVNANNSLHDQVRTRKFSLSKKMSERKSMENEKDGKRGKITSFFVSKERTEIGKVIVRVVHTLPPDYQLFDHAMLNLLVCSR